MTTEREQLILAAKACGLHFNPTLKLKQGIRVVRPDAKCQSDQVLWDPKNDDGDCARMEARLGIDLIWYTTKIQTVDTTGNYRATAFFEDHNGDKNAARRAASLAVAAEIGRALRAALGEEP